MAGPHDHDDHDHAPLLVDALPEADPACGPTEHAPLAKIELEPHALERAVRLFKALGDEARLRTLQMLIAGEACVSELAAANQEQISTVSHRLRLLRAEGLVQKRRAGRHIYYSLADEHVVELIRNAIAHASEH
ncbi:ArsR/SmtB family transcription factor [Nannocystaceae bacterium ST9]